MVTSRATGTASGTVVVTEAGGAARRPCHTVAVRRLQACAAAAAARGLARPQLQCSHCALQIEVAGEDLVATVRGKQLEPRPRSSLPSISKFQGFRGPQLEHTLI